MSPISSDRVRAWLGRHFFPGVIALLALVISLPLRAENLAVPDRLGVEMVADFLDRGAVAVYERLDPKSPLASMQEADALAEIDARLGPSAGTQWTLASLVKPTAVAHSVFEVSYPSGLEEIVMFVWTNGPDGQPRLADIELSTDGAGAPTPVEHGVPFVILCFGVIAALLAFTGAAIRHSKGAFSTLLLLGSSAFFLCAVAAVVRPEFRLAVESMGRGYYADPGGVRELSNYRFALSRNLATPLPDLTSSGPLRARALQWAATAKYIEGDRQGASALLGRVEGDSLRIALLRARLALAGLDVKAAREHYAAARGFTMFTDGLARESFLCSLLTGSGITLGSIRQVAGRNAELYYLAAGSASGGEDGGLLARELFQRGWNLRPISREAVVRNILPTFSGPDQMIGRIAGLTQPGELVVRAPDLSVEPVKVPARAKSFATGDFVRIVIEDRTLDIPGAAAVAPEGAEVVSAEYWELAETDSVVRNLDRFRALARYQNPPPQLLARLEGATDSLVARGRWEDVLELTASIVPTRPAPSATLLRNRVAALVRTGRVAAVSAFARSTALARIAAEKDAATMVFVAESFAAAGQLQAAIDLYRDVPGVEPRFDVTYRINQLELRLGLMASEPTAKTEHFEIRCTRDVPPAVAIRVGELLEAELARLRVVLGASTFELTRVNIVSWENFAVNFTGSEHVVGLYDGEITLPFAAVQQFRREIVGIVTHELAHAVIAQNTRDHAPRWFQEGLASRVEWLPEQSSIFSKSSDDLIALSLADAVLESSIDPVRVSNTYELCQTFFHFVEATRGEDAVRRMIRAYGAGGGDDTVFRDVLGASVPEVDREFREWGRTHVTSFVDASPWPYGHMYSLGVDPSVSRGIRFSKDRP
ncbi:MAG: hypothetical protein WC538_24655 [Thermoanaerobaculia bacterium]